MMAHVGGNTLCVGKSDASNNKSFVNIGTTTDLILPMTTIIKK